MTHRFRLPTAWKIKFMKLSPSREAASCAATQELPNILWNPKVRYRVQKRPSLVPNLNQINQVIFPKNPSMSEDLRDIS
jgi:hypothetical protein